MIEKIRWYMEEQHMAGPGSRIVVGVSGGGGFHLPASCACPSAPSFQWKLAVVHVTILIRRGSGGGCRLCGGNLQAAGGFLYLTPEEDVEALAKSRGLSVEEAGRQVRYRAFMKRRKALGPDRIAVAHNRNDRAETLLSTCSPWDRPGRHGIHPAGAG